jgi:predicted DNA-binding transcriptional regulator AlpA
MGAITGQTDRLAFSVKEFCESIGGITRQHFYTLKRQGKAPKTFKIGRRTLVSTEAAREWLGRLQAESDTTV